MSVTKPHILCVDDERGVLEALQRVLKNDFEVSIANSAESALDSLEKHSNVAVILSDFRMPGMTGVELLRHAKTIRPQAVRAILSGQMDLSQLTEAINRAEIHRFILKPWENEVLRVQMLEALQTHHALEESRRLRHLSITDPVTGLTNHRYFQEKLVESIEQGEATNEKFCLLMIDVDHFKTYNDRYGHPEGDRLLADISDLLSKHVDGRGIVSRYGGEEFVVIFPNTTLASAQKDSEKLRSKIEQHVFAGPMSRRAYITVSLGLAEYPGHGRSPADLIAAADRALYQAKRQGRNQTATAVIS